MTLADVRRDERVRSFLRARILFNNNNSSIDCTIKNISASGAKIVLPSGLAVPNEFDLDVPQRGRTYRAQLVWRDDEALGVQFVEKTAADTAQLETRATQLERENLRLKATIAILTKRLENLGQAVASEDF